MKGKMIQKSPHKPLNEEERKPVTSLVKKPARDTTSVKKPLQRLFNEAEIAEFSYSVHGFDWMVPGEKQMNNEKVTSKLKEHKKSSSREQTNKGLVGADKLLHYGKEPDRLGNKQAKGLKGIERSLSKSNGSGKRFTKHSSNEEDPKDLDKDKDSTKRATEPTRNRKSKVDGSDIRRLVI